MGGWDHILPIEFYQTRYVMSHTTGLRKVNQPLIELTATVVD